MKLKDRLREWYRQLLSLHGEPHSIAFGFAIGIFVGVTPTIPFHTILIIALCFFWKKNATAGFLGSWLISNPLTIPFLYVTQYRLGKLLLGSHTANAVIRDYSLLNLMHRGWAVLAPCLLGGFIMAPFIALPAYFITYKTIKIVRKKHHGHHDKKHP